MQSLFIFFVLLCTLQCCDGQQNIRGGKKKPRPRDRLERNGINNELDNKMIKAVTINYPLKFFDGRQNEDWKTPAQYSKELVIQTESAHTWTEVAKAQDFEDIWLYENWFYGMEKGVILESGALDGVIFSTSSMFELLANWSAIHVGQCLLFIRAYHFLIYLKRRIHCYLTEADPENYANLVSNRENAVNINAALCSEPRLLHYSSVSVIPARGFIEFMTESFIKKWHGKVCNNITLIKGKLSY